MEYENGSVLCLCNNLNHYAIITTHQVTKMEREEYGKKVGEREEREGKNKGRGEGGTSTNDGAPHSQATTDVGLVIGLVFVALALVIVGAAIAILVGPM